VIPEELRQAALIKASLRDEPCECEVAGQPFINARSAPQFRTLFAQHCTYCCGRLRADQRVEFHRHSKRTFRLEAE